MSPKRSYKKHPEMERGNYETLSYFNREVVITRNGKVSTGYSQVYIIGDLHESHSHGVAKADGRLKWT